jgi:hypothetical protein
MKKKARKTTDVVLLGKCGVVAVIMTLELFPVVIKLLEWQIVP